MTSPLGAPPTDVQVTTDTVHFVAEAWYGAQAGWEHAVTQAGPGTVVFSAAYGILALLMVAAHHPTSTLAATAGRPGHGDRDPRWLAAASVLALLAGTTLLHLDLLLVLFMRGLARSLGWYAQRGPWQVAAVLALVVVAVWGRHRWLRRRTVARLAAPQRRRLRNGLTLLALLAGLRVVSLHQVDQWLAVSLGVASLGRSVEACGLVLVALALWPALRAR
ncbi:MAG: hypothetical protein RL375_2009 [Pseudomonadota bacterium]|jgi:hypothetical protein